VTGTSGSSRAHIAWAVIHFRPGSGSFGRSQSTLARGAEEFRLLNIVKVNLLLLAGLLQGLKLLFELSDITLKLGVIFLL